MIGSLPSLQISRLRAIPGDVKKGPRGEEVAHKAEELLDRNRPGDFNQAVMELGATVCLPSGVPKASSPVTSLREHASLS